MTDRPNTGTRLDSWKAIAAYLQRDVRTAQRWHRDAGMPVHRVANARVRSVFAYSHEIDRWLADGVPSDAESGGDALDADVPRALDSDAPAQMELPQPDPAGSTPATVGDPVAPDPPAVAPPPRRVSYRFAAIAAALVIAVAASVALMRGGHGTSAADDRIRQALELAESGTWAPAERLLEDAVRLAPESALARAYYAVAVANTTPGGPGHAARVTELARTARRLADRRPGPERHFVAGVAHALEGDQSAAAHDLAAHLKTRPDDLWAVRFRTAALLRQNRFAEAAAQAEQGARAWPSNFRANAEAAEALVQWRGDVEGALPYARRAARLRSANPGAHRPFHVAFVAMLPAYDEWRQRRFAAAARETARAWEDLLAYSNPAAQAGASIAVNLFLTIGQPTPAREVIERVADPDLRDSLQALLTDLQDDREELRRIMQRADPASMRYAPESFAKAGLYDEARAAAAALQTATPPLSPGWIDAYIAFLRGDPAETRAYLERHGGSLLASFPDAHLPAWYAEVAAGALERSGDLAQAVRTLERGTRAVPGFNGWGVAGAQWLRTRIHLLRVYDRVGRRSEAERLRADLEAYLSEAEPTWRLRILLNPRAASLPSRFVACCRLAEAGLHL